jgi:hypothetical protein
MVKVQIDGTFIQAHIYIQKRSGKQHHIVKKKRKRKTKNIVPPILISRRVPNTSVRYCYAKKICMHRKKKQQQQ